MVETGSYNVNKNRRKDTSFKSFICALLAFLAILILISLLLFALMNRGSGSDDLGSKRDFEFLRGKNNTKNENEKLTKTIKFTSSTSSSTDKSPNLIIADLTTDKITTTDDSATTTDHSSSTTDYSSTTTDYSSTTTDDSISVKPSSELNYKDGEYNSTTRRSTSTIRTSTLDPTSTLVGVMVPVITAAPVPTTCKYGICKRAASSMLAIMNHDDKLDRCEDYYKFICEGSDKINEHAFFHDSFKGFIKKINEVTTSSEKYMQLFADFYKNCNKFGNSNNRLERLKYLRGTEGVNLTESMTTAILAQTLPFFDIGLNLNETNFKIEINLPGMSYLKTTLEHWSLMEQLTNICINKQSDKIDQPVIELAEISTNIKTCIGEKTSQYVKDFAEEMKQLSALPDFDFLDANFKAATQTGDLMEILNVVQESLAAYRNTNYTKIKETTLLNLKTNYDFGLDWIELFKGITKDLTIDENTIVYQSIHLEEVFKKLIEKKANLQPLVDLWHNIELYENIVIEKKIDDRGFNCLKITSELMPDVSSAIISELNADKQDFYKEVKSLMNNLKVNIYTSLAQVNMTEKSAAIIQDRLHEINFIMPPATPEVDGLNYLEVFHLKDPYPKKVIGLISNFRKMLFSMHEDIVGDSLLMYFVNAFATKPNSFPPSRAVVFQPGFLYGKSTKLPTYVKIAKLGLPLAMQISRHFTKNDFKNLLDPREISIYEEMEETFNSEYLMNRTKYFVEDTNIEVEDGHENHLSYDNIFSDNMAFRLGTDTFTDDKKLEYLPFLQDYTREESFIIIALQEYCHKNTLADFIGDYYNGLLPAPIKFRNMLKNSEFYSKQFNCTEPFERKQFPYIKHSTP